MNGCVTNHLGREMHRDGILIQLVATRLAKGWVLVAQVASSPRTSWLHSSSMPQMGKNMACVCVCEREWLAGHDVRVQKTNLSQTPFLWSRLLCLTVLLSTLPLSLLKSLSEKWLQCSINSPF